MNYQELKGVDVVKEIRKEIKAKFQIGYKFSIVQEHYSMGWSIHISLMQSSIKIVKDFSDLSEMAVFEYTQDGRSKDQLKQMQESGYYQLNQFQLREAYNSDGWCNGVFLTEEGHKVLSEVVRITDKYNWNNSDSQTDYYDVNFHLSLNIGRWDKPYIREGV
jgi:hypothetical protein